MPTIALQDWKAKNICLSGGYARCFFWNLSVGIQCVQLSVSALFLFFQFHTTTHYTPTVQFKLSPPHVLHACVLKSLQSCLTLCDPMGCSPPGSSVRGILLVRRLEWNAMPSSSRILSNEFCAHFLWWNHEAKVQKYSWGMTREIKAETCHCALNCVP